CIRDVLAGKTYLAPAAAAKLAEGVSRVQLTPRELATLKLLADGKANKEIANELDISERTVKTHLAHLFEKLGVTSRTEAVKVAPRGGWVRWDGLQAAAAYFSVPSKESNSRGFREAARPKLFAFRSTLPSRRPLIKIPRRAESVTPPCAGANQNSAGSPDW